MSGREPNPEDPPYRERPPGGPPWPGYPNPPPPVWVPPLKLAKGKKSKFNFDSKTSANQQNKNIT